MVNSLRFLVHQTLPYIWWKHGLRQLPQDLMVNEWVDTVRRALHVETFLAAKEWEKYLERNWERMAHNQELFCRYVLFACFMEKSYAGNVFDKYLRIVAIGVYSAMYINDKGRPYGIDVLATVLDKFFQDQMSDTVVEKDFWKTFSVYVIRKGYLQHHLVVEEMLLDGRRQDEILEAVAKDSTIRILARNGTSVCEMPKKLIEHYDAAEEIMTQLKAMIFAPYVFPYTPQLMDEEQKFEAATRLNQQATAVSRKLFGVTNLLQMANSSLETNFNLRERLQRVPTMAKVPDRLILDYLHKLGESL